MTPAVGSRAAGSPDDAASVALQGASLAFQKRTPPSQHQPEHSRENGALLAATSSVERAKSPGSTTAAARSSPRRSHPGQRVAADASPPEIESVLAAGLVVARLQQLGASSTAGTASQTTAPTPMVTTAPRAHSTSPSPHLALGLASPQLPATVAAAKNPSLIAATLAASRGGSPTVTALRNPRRMQSVNALQDLDAVDSQPIPPTTSLISMFEVDEAAGQDTPRLRQVPTSLTEPSVVRKSTRPSPIPIKQITVESAPPTSKSNSKQRTGKGQSYERPPTPPKAVGKKSAACAPRRPPTPPAVTEAAPAPAPITPTSASKAIFRAAASKPRLTPPKVRATRKADGPSNPVTPSKVTSQTLSTTAMKNLDATGDVTPRRKRVRKPSPLGLSKPSKDGRIPDIAPPKQDSPTTPRHKSPTPRVISRSTPEVLSPKPTRVTRTASLHSGTPPPAIILRPMYDVQSPPSPDPQKRTNAEKRPPTPPKPRSSQRLAPARLASGRPRGSSDTPLTKATPVHSMWGLPIVSSTTPDTPRISKTEPWPPNRRESIVNAPPSPTHEPPRKRPTHPPNPLQLNSMTNAIMASSLASSRLTPHSSGSSSLPPPPLPLRQRSPHLLQTLRQPASEPEDDHGRQRKSRRRRLHGAKHTHHEGSRRRWRDQVTDKERKRYEALWASNRGLLLTHESPSVSVGSGLGTDLSECVANVVVREIWKRARLPTEELAEVWELVDRGRRGYLSRQEFVVGMFLIDQRLRGRKLPPKVSDSIWGSVNGVTVLTPRPKH